MLNFAAVKLFDVTFFLHIQIGRIQIPFDLVTNTSMVISTKDFQQYDKIPKCMW